MTLLTALRVVSQRVGSRRWTHSVKHFDRIVIANRGEIACRVIKTARRMGIQTVAVFSDADAAALHVSMADEAHYIGPAPSQQSYLRGDVILDVAKATNAQAVHPGYGFLSENAEFAEQCSKNDVTFIGPPPKAITDMGIKSKAKSIMSDAGVPIIEGYHGSDQSAAVIREHSDRIGFPVMLKAVRGGGGKGMRIALSPAEFDAQLDSAKREAMKSFGNDDMIVEKFVPRPRHVEVQVFADSHGNCVYLWERDCSIQRRHQKVLEEAPAPGLDQATRERLGEAAVKAALAVGYVGAGTVEFIMDEKKDFYFMEMNTRLQVEHPVTEMITDQDLVEWQILVAQGYPLPIVNQSDVPMNGQHAIEARIYAENPDDNFMPGAGPLLHLSPPVENANVRVDTGVVQGDEVSVYYDPMIAKLIARGPNREIAIASLASALQNYHIAGLKTNIRFLSSILRHPGFMSGDVYTDFIADHHDDLFPPSDHSAILPSSVAIQLAGGYILTESFELVDRYPASYMSSDPFAVTDGFRLNMQHQRTLRLANDNTIHVTYEQDGSYTMVVNNGKSVPVQFDLLDISSNGHVVEFRCIFGPRSLKSKVVRIENQLHLYCAEGQFETSIPEPSWVEDSIVSGDAGGLVAPMPGVIEKILVEVGQEVKANDPLVVMIAMKMEYVIKAPAPGKVASVLCQMGESVAKDKQLVVLESE